MREENTGSGGSFPRTRHSAVQGLGSSDKAVRERSLSSIAGLYWKPVYTYLRLGKKLSSDDAADITQDFFAALVEKQLLTDFDPSKARFRTYLRLCLDRMLAKAHARENRQKRGGDFQFISLDFTQAELEISNRQSNIPAPDSLFDHEWTRSLLADSVSTLKRLSSDSGRELHFKIFEEYLLLSDDSDSKPTYQELATKYGRSITDITNYLSSMRREFKLIVLDRIREVTASEEEYREEVRAIFGAAQ